MSGEGTLLRYEQSDGVARLTLNRPKKRNALNAALVRELGEALTRADLDSTVRAVAVAGTGPDFCAGADLGELLEGADAGPLESLADADRMADLFLKIRRLGKPVVALVHGRALGGGCGLATSCDLVIAKASATFGYPEVHLGFVPAMVMAILRRNVSEKRAFELITLGHSMDAAEAERIGLINRVIDDDGFDKEAGRFIGELAARSGSAVRLAKRLLYLQDGMTYEAAVRAGADLNAIARSSEDARKGVDRFLDRPVS